MRSMTALSTGAAQAIAAKFPWHGHETFVDVGAAEVPGGFDYTGEVVDPTSRPSTSRTTSMWKRRWKRQGAGSCRRRRRGPRGNPCRC
jgi:hypothetical protein